MYLPGCRNRCLYCMRITSKYSCLLVMLYRRPVRTRNCSLVTLFRQLVPGFHSRPMYPGLRGSAFFVIISVYRCQATYRNLLALGCEVWQCRQSQRQDSPSHCRSSQIMALFLGSQKSVSWKYMKSLKQAGTFNVVFGSNLVHYSIALLVASFLTSSVNRWVTLETFKRVTNYKWLHVCQNWIQLQRFLNSFKSNLDRQWAATSLSSVVAELNYFFY